MSFLWHFSSYDDSKLQSLDAPTVCDALLWDEGAFDDATAVERLATHIATNGISYDSLSDADRDLLDELVPLIFSPEGLESTLDCEPESDDGIHPFVIQEMLKHSGSAEILPWLIHGRRHDCSTPDVSCNYVLLNSSQVSQLLAECTSILNGNPSWSESYVPDVIRDCLTATLESIQTKGKHAVGVLG